MGLILLLREVSMILNRKQLIEQHVDKLAEKRDKWINRNSYFYKNDHSYMKFLVEENVRVLELGCGTGQLLSALNPSHGVGVDLSANAVNIAQKNYPNLEFIQGDIENPELIKSLKGTFDYIILSDTLGFLDDCEETFSSLHALCTSDTRLIISYYSWRWQPILTLGEKIGLKMPSLEMNWLSTEDTMGFLHLADFEPVKREWRQLIPRSLFGLGTIVNRFIGTLPLIRRLSLRNYIVARSVRKVGLEQPSTTVLIPCRNEKGNIENAVKRLPDFCEDL